MVTYGDNFERKLDMTPNGLVQSDTAKNIGKEIIYARLTKDDHLITVDRGTNDITIRDVDTNQVLMNNQGNQEQPFGNLNFKNRI